MPRNGLFIAIVGAVIGAIIGAVLTFGIPLLYCHFTCPPPPSVVTDLMNQEAFAAQVHDTSVVRRIYAPEAAVTDAACHSSGSRTIWTGLAQIQARYDALPTFASLEHVNAQVHFEPDSASASRANATADTIGVIAPANTSQKPQFIVGHEEWTFTLTNGQWLVNSFTYNLCLPA